MGCYGPARFRQAHLAGSLTLHPSAPRQVTLSTPHYAQSAEGAKILPLSVRIKYMPYKSATHDKGLDL